MLSRQANRFRLILEHRKLARLETALGLLGWQQADYDAPTQQHVNRLTAYEREQGRLTNDSASIGLEIERVEERRGVAAREFAEAQAVALEKEFPGAANAEAFETQVVAKRNERREIESRLPVMDRELRDAEDRYRELVKPERPTAHVQAQLLQCRKVILALPREKAEWEAKLQQVAAELPPMETMLKALKEAGARFEKRDREWADEIASLQRSKRKVEKQIESLEKAKSDPYRVIGRTLADQNIGPLNQPEALKAVLEQRKKVAVIDAAIAVSLAASASEKGTTHLPCWLLAAGLAGAGMAALLAIGAH